MNKELERIFWLRSYRTYRKPTELTVTYRKIRCKDSAIKKKAAELPGRKAVLAATFLVWQSSRVLWLVRYRANTLLSGQQHENLFMIDSNPPLLIEVSITTPESLCCNVNSQFPSSGVRPGTNCLSASVPCSAWPKKPFQDLEHTVHLHLWLLTYFSHRHGRPRLTFGVTWMSGTIILRVPVTLKWQCWKFSVVLQLQAHTHGKLTMGVQ